MKQWIFLITLAISLACTQMNAVIGSWAPVPVAEEARGEGGFLRLYAQSTVLIDGDIGRILYGKRQDTIRSMAGITRVMTCTLALENGRGEDTAKASPNTASQPKMHLGVREEGEYRPEDPLYVLVLEFYNDVAMMVAEHIGGSVEGFAAIMNGKAVGLGCGDTYFIMPNGLDGVRTDEQGKEHIHSTTASGSARIMWYHATESPARDELLRITQT